MPLIPAPPSVITHDGTRLLIPGRTTQEGRAGHVLTWDETLEDNRGGAKWQPVPTGGGGGGGGSAAPLGSAVVRGTPTGAGSGGTSGTFFSSFDLTIASAIDDASVPNDFSWITASDLGGAFHLEPGWYSAVINLTCQSGNADLPVPDGMALAFGDVDVLASGVCYVTGQRLEDSRGVNYGRISASVSTGPFRPYSADYGIDPSLSLQVTGAATFATPAVGITVSRLA